jgi:hypothetical protein
VSLHELHLAVAALVEPLLQPCLVGPQVDAGDPDLLETERAGVRRKARLDPDQLIGRKGLRHAAGR